MKVYAVFRHGRKALSEWHVYKLFKEKKDADAFVASKNPNACNYAYAVKAMKVE